MIGLAKLAHTMLGDGPWLQGLACTANSPAAMNVLVAPGQIYSLQNIDGTAYSSLNADTTHSILKQGVSLDTVTLSTPAPVTAGYSVNYLVQIAYIDTDSTPIVLPYYNASNPAVAFSGPNNTGAAQNTVRKGVCSIQIKTGVAATTGTQLTPAPDAGYIGAYVITVDNGATTVTAPNIVAYAGAPFITETLTQKIGTTTGDARYAKLAGLATQQFNVANATAASQAVALGQFINSFAGNGYAKLPGGLILQWGIAAVGQDTTALITLPIGFTAAIYFASTQYYSGTINTSGTGIPGTRVDLNSLTQITLYNDQLAGNMGWFAIGY